MKIPLQFGTKHQATPKGFTLVELLVVITIIVVLAALTTITVSKVRSAARGATCTSNLRQVGAAMLSYTSENNGQLPPLEDRTAPGDGLKGIWPGIVATSTILSKTLSKSGQLGTNAGVWTCPECVPTNLLVGGYGVVEGTVLKVQKGSQPAAKGSLRLSEIPKPERTWLVGDALDKSSDLKSCWYAIWANPASWGGHSPGPRHGGKVNVCMVDGHVESLTMKELQSPDKDYTMFKK